MNNWVKVDGTITANGEVVVSTLTNASSGSWTTTSLSSGSAVKPASVEAAVFAHIKALRALGRTTVNTGEIARALALPLRDVEAAAARLRSKGVRTAA